MIFGIRMKENVFDVLIYLFENYLEDESRLATDPDTVRDELLEAGFPAAEISKAFHWLESLTETHPLRPSTSFRVFCAEEMARLDVECRGFLLFLEQCGILNPASRELVIDRAMALAEENLTLDDLKWLILLVLFSQPDEETAYARMEHLMDHHLPAVWH